MGHTSVVYKLFDKSSGTNTPGGTVKIEIMSNHGLAEELHKPIISKFEKWKRYSSFNDSIWAADLVDMQLISKFNKGICFLLCIIDIYSNM